MGDCSRADTIHVTQLENGEFLRCVLPRGRRVFGVGPPGTGNPLIELLTCTRNGMACAGEAQDIVRAAAVFVSSSMAELAEDRTAISNTLKEDGIEGWVFEIHAGARPSSIRRTYLEELADCDFYIGLFYRSLGSGTRD
jgi:hypothetical protein